MKSVKVIQGVVLIFLLALANSNVQAQSRPSTTPSASPSAKASARLTDAKLKACQTREEAIQKRSDQLVRMATNMQETFTSIMTRVKTYYTDTVLPSGKSLNNYDTLLADIATKQTEVGTSLAKAQSDAMAFSCTAEDPKGQLTNFRTSMQSVKSALQDYRTSIKNLIVAIRSITGTTQSSAKPTSSPTATPTP